jgi:quinoprotein glucose dehydrogenase
VLAFGRLYLETATNVVIALDPESGRERWRFDPHIDRARRYAEASARGVSAWAASDAAGGVCRRRIFSGTLDARLLALDADTGRPCSDFGAGGQVDLTRGLRIRDVGAYLVTSPPAVFGKVVIVGSAIGDNRAADVERGVIRAYDAESGAQLWSFDPLPDSALHPAAADWNLAQAQRTGAGNAWGVMSVDHEHGLVLVPTGSASPDYYGGQRLGTNRFADSLLALDARSGRLVWQQQLIHHDLWDYDLAAQPVLGDVEVQGMPVPAVIQATKTGMLYVFERSHGQPLFPVTERRVPSSHVAGEQAWPTQPFSSLPPLAPQRAVLAADAWGLTVWDRGKCRNLIAALRNEGVFTPPDTRGTLLTPGYIGGVNWGGVAFDQDHGRIIAAVNLLPMVVTLLTPAEFEREVRSGDYPHSQFGRQAGTPLGCARERRPAAQSHRLAIAARLDRRLHALVPAGARVRHAQHGRSDRHRRGTGVRRCRHGRLPARLRHRDGGRAVEAQAACRWSGDPHDVPRRSEPAPVPSDQCRRTRTTRHSAR